MKYAVVTGADRGLGYALAVQLLDAGYTVFAGQFMPDWPALDRLKEERGERLIVLPLDISNGSSVGEAAARIAALTDRVDLLVNNAGLGGDYTSSIFGEIDYERLERIYRVNAMGPLRVTQALNAPLLQGEHKLVVNISSEAGQINQASREGWYGYCMSKAALNIQSNILHNQLRKHGGKVLVIHPGWMQSYISGTLNESAAITPDEAATGIMSIIGEYAAETTDRKHPAFRDYSGAEMSWT